MPLSTQNAMIRLSTCWSGSATTETCPGAVDKVLWTVMSILQQHKQARYAAYPCKLTTAVGSNSLETRLVSRKSHWNNIYILDQDLWKLREVAFMSFVVYCKWWHGSLTIREWNRLTTLNNIENIDWAIEEKVRICRTYELFPLDVQKKSKKITLISKFE